MDWPSAVLAWVRAMKLTECTVESLKELSDGNFLSEIVYLLGYRGFTDVWDQAQIFQILEQRLKGKFTPPDWIDFRKAGKGSTDELIKIISVVIGVCTLESERIEFLERPSKHASFEAQLRLTKFLESVLKNGKVIDERFVPKGEAPRAIYFTSDRGIVFRHGKGDTTKKDSPLRKFLSTKVLSAERLLMSEKNNENSTLRTQVGVLTAKNEEFEKEISGLKEKLKKGEEGIDKESKMKDLQVELEALKAKIQGARAVRELQLPQ